MFGNHFSFITDLKSHVMPVLQICLTVQAYIPLIVLISATSVLLMSLFVSALPCVTVLTTSVNPFHRPYNLFS